MVPTICSRVPRSSAKSAGRRLSLCHARRSILSTTRRALWVNLVVPICVEVVRGRMRLFIRIGFPLLSTLLSRYHFGHCLPRLCFSAYSLSNLLNLASASAFLHVVLLTCMTLLAKICAAGSRSLLLSLMVEKNWFALWLLFLLLKTSMTAAVRLPIFVGVAVAASSCPIFCLVCCCWWLALS